MVVAELLRSILELPGEFLEVATHDPLAAVLIAIGAVLVGGPMLVGGIYVAGAFLELVSSGPRGEQHPQE